jgi:hypothetical protein
MPLSNEPIHPVPCHEGQRWARKRDGAELIIRYTIQPEANVKYVESGVVSYIHLSRFIGPDAKYVKLKEPDYIMGDFVYCGSHRAPHETGWCTVHTDNKIGLKATTASDAFEEVKAMGLPIYNYCDICYKYIANEPWMRQPKPDGGFRLTCPEHDEDK